MLVQHKPQNYVLLRVRWDARACRFLPPSILVSGRIAGSKEGTVMTDELCRDHTCTPFLLKIAALKAAWWPPACSPLLHPGWSVLLFLPLLLLVLLLLIVEGRKRSCSTLIYAITEQTR